MAKLSARGRTELARMVKDEAVTDSDSVTRRRTTVALMSDGVVLKKDDAMFKATTYSPAKMHSWGWKKYAKLKEMKADSVEAFKALFTKRGYV